MMNRIKLIPQMLADTIVDSLRPSQFILSILLILSKTSS
jgi:hypothetical protein